MKRLLYVPGKPGVTFFDAVCDYDNIVTALHNASHARPHDPAVQYALHNEEKCCKSIQNMLLNKAYHTSEYDVFTKYEHEKERVIYKLPFFPDRIVHWAILQQIGPTLESKFIKNTYSSIKGRGPLKCLQDINKDILEHPDETFYCLKIDIRKFYPSINHDILKSKYERIFKDSDLLWLLSEIIDSVPEDEGIPIGNYLSQFSGNLYLTDFDHWIKEEKHIKFYYRYMDDMVFLCNSKDTLWELLSEIRDYIDQLLHLHLKPNYQIFPVDDRGLDFVGYVIFHDHVLVRRRVADGYKRCVVRCLQKRELTIHDISQYFAYKGFITYSNHHNLHRKYGMMLENMFNMKTGKRL